LFFNYTNGILKQAYILKKNVIVITVTVNCYTLCDVWHFAKYYSSMWLWNNWTKTYKIIQKSVSKHSYTEIRNQAKCDNRWL